MKERQRLTSYAARSAGWVEPLALCGGSGE